MSDERCSHELLIDGYDECRPCREDYEQSVAMQEAEMRAETFAAEAIMGLPPGTTEGWYDEPEPMEYDGPDEDWEEE